MYALSFFAIGFLVIIFIQNLFFYNTYKDKAYLWYALYSLIIIVDQLYINFRRHKLFIHDLDALQNLSSVHTALEWLYNSAYLIFVVEFGGKFLFSKKQAKNVKNIVYFLAIVMLIAFNIDLVYKTSLVRNGFLIVQVPMLILLSIYIYVYLFRMKSIVKYYLIPGSMAFSIFSILALLASLSKNNVAWAWQFFYIGVFLENIFFSMGLAVKQKVVINERNTSQLELIKQKKKNEELRNSITKKLKDEVSRKTIEIVSLNKKAEEEKIKQLEIEFDKQMVEMKVSSLQSQMNPHFIFNSLNSIKLYIIKNDKENAVYYLNKFSKLIRKILTASREKEVSLQEELETLELYANIENIRFKNEIQISLVIDEKLNLSTIKIPPLILQPFIENAIWHGLSNKKDNKKLSIEVLKKEEGFVQIKIKDNGIGRKKSAEIKSRRFHKKESIGLKLTQERLISFSKKFNNDFTLVFYDLEENNQASGTEVIINLPTI